MSTQTQTQTNVEFLMPSELSAAQVSYQKKIFIMEMYMRKLLTDDSHVSGLVIYGPPGGGKTHAVNKLKEEMADQGWHFKDLSGKITPKGLFNTLMDNCQKRDCIIIDDTDSAFSDTTALNVLKGALDRGKGNRVTWFTQKEDIDFVFEGRIIILTNYRMKSSAHFTAFMDRVNSFNYALNQAEVKALSYAIMMDNVASGVVSAEVAEELMSFLFKVNRQDLTLRFLGKLIGWYRDFGDMWEMVAENDLHSMD